MQTVPVVIQHAFQGAHTVGPTGRRSIDGHGRDSRDELISSCSVPVQNVSVQREVIILGIVFRKLPKLLQHGRRREDFMFLRIFTRLRIQNGADCPKQVLRLVIQQCLNVCHQHIV